MKYFWDTSAAINAAVSPTGSCRLKADGHVARLHLFLEFFSTMTGRGVPGKDANGNPVVLTFDANDAARWLRDFAAKVQLVDLDGAETLAELDKAQARNVQGARVYDYAHALVEINSGAEVVLPRNRKDVSAMTGNERVKC